MVPSIFFGKIPLLQESRILFLLFVTISTIGINIAGIFSGVTIVLSHLMYFPIILAAYWYPKRCYPFLVFIAAVYSIIVIAFNYPPDFSLVAITVSRVVIFTLIGVIVSLLSFRLRKSERQLNDIIGFLPDATFAIDMEGRVIAWNRAIEELTGVKRADIINKGNYEYAIPFYGSRRPILVDLALNEEDLDIQKYYPEMRKESGSYIADILIPRFRGQSGVYLHFSATALKDPYGNVTGAIETIRDVTDMVMTGSALSNTTRQLNTISRIVQTDISGQLDLVTGYLADIEPDVPENPVEKIRQSMYVIRRKLDALNDFSDVGTEPPAWIGVQDEILATAGRLHFGGVELHPWTERLEVFADPHLPVVFYNLFENALKFKREVTRLVVTYHIREDRCHIVVEDDGPGIDKSDKEGLFSRGFEEGYGYGLFLSHEILSITGIGIKEAGLPGKGARFELIVPSEGFRIDGGKDEAGEAEETSSPGEESLPVARELRANEFRKADSIWADYHNTKGDPGSDRIFGVLLGDILVSVARCRRHNDGYEVDGVFTPADYRKRGYSHLAVGALVEACHNDDLYMFAVAHLTGFYRKYGFREIPADDLPEGVSERYSWAKGNLEGAGVQPMVRFHTVCIDNKTG